MSDDERDVLGIEFSWNLTFLKYPYFCFSWKHFLIFKKKNYHFLHFLKLALITFMRYILYCPLDDLFMLIICFIWVIVHIGQDKSLWILQILFNMSNSITIFFFGVYSKFTGYLNKFIESVVILCVL